MVYESYPWKQELLRQKKSIIKYNTHEEYLKPNDLAYTMVEKGIFYSAFIIRKLIDCNGKMSDAADNYTFKVQAIKPLKEINSIRRWPDSDTHEWEKEVTLTVLGRDICNWLIHSYVFFAVENDKPFSCFCVSSDYDRNKYLYMISMEDWLKYMDFIATDYVVEIDSHYDECKKDYVYTKKTRG